MPEDRGRKRWGVVVVPDVFAVDLGERLVYPLLRVCGVGIVGATFFKGQADKLAATRNTRPVDEFVGNVLGFGN